MGFLDFLTGGKKVSPVTIDPRNSQRQAIDQFLAQYVNQGGTPYNKPLTAPMGALETQGIDQFLRQYLNSNPMTPQITDIQSFLQKTINGGYDPKTSPYYQAYRDTSDYNRKKAITDTNIDLGSRGKYFSSEAIAKTGDINAQTANALNLTNADLADKERSRSLSAVPYATGLEQFLQQIPLQKATAATTIGAIPRTIQQSDLESQYQAFKDNQNRILTAAGGVSSTQTSQGYPNPTLQSGDNSLMTLLSGVLGSSAGQGALSSLGAAGAGALSSIGGGLMSFLPMLFCWVAAEVFGSWEHPKTIDCRYYIGIMAPDWLRNLYAKHGERFAAFIKDKPVLKAAIRPLFEVFAVLGKKGREAEYGIA